MSAHDPLCPMWSKVWAGDRCNCTVIANVRADQTAQCIAAVEGLPGVGAFIAGEGNTIGRKYAVRALRALLEGEK